MEDVRQLLSHRPLFKTVFIWDMKPLDIINETWGHVQLCL